MPETNVPTTRPGRPLRAVDEVELAFDLAPVGLCVSHDRTIDGHRARIMKKVGARSASEMISRLVGLR